MASDDGKVPCTAILADGTRCWSTAGCAWIGSDERGYRWLCITHYLEPPDEVVEDERLKRETP